MYTIPLTNGWELRAYSPDRSIPASFSAPEGWIPAQVPGTVHEALIAAERIPDPFAGLNELEVQWVGERDWLYRCTFEVRAEDVAAGPAALCFAGLDTFATVWLNGQHLVSSSNMFIPHRLPLGTLLRTGQNHLWVHFASALRRGKELEARYGQTVCWNGDSSRVYVRKAQYHYGWDWGPSLLTAGPWRTVTLEFGAARISELHVPTTVRSNLATATLPVALTVEATDATPLTLHLTLADPDGQEVDAVTLPVTDRQVQHAFTLHHPRLWWPRGYGAQARYQLHVTLLRAGMVVDERNLLLGLRHLRLVHAPIEGEPGSSFYFEVNGVPIFSGGANWVPADSFVGRVSPADYRAWIAQATTNNMVMLRVWGGGIYEDDEFYLACDAAGVLVWQDFMFACGMYPAYPEFQASVRAEAEAQVRRLRHYACIALWCGNNEDYQLAESLNVYDPDFTGDHTTTRFPARQIYEQLLPKVCASLDPTRAYWPGSPYGGRSVFASQAGDRHTWEVWHGAMAPYQHYPRYAGRFVSEFGMQAAPVMRTVEHFGNKADLRPHSRLFEHHNKAADGPRRLAAYLSDTVDGIESLEAYVYATQLVQAEALAAAYSGFRRRWGGPGHYAVGGALVWQLNDCWPATSWSIVDYFRRPKPAAYVIRRALAPCAIGMAHGNEGSDVWVTNGTLHPIETELLLTRYALDGRMLYRQQEHLVLAPNQTTEIERIERLEDGSVLSARLMVNGTVSARATLWPEPLKYLDPEPPGITITTLPDGRLRITALRPAKGVWLDGGDAAIWSDNMLDLMPSEPQEIVVQGLQGQPKVSFFRHL